MAKVAIIIPTMNRPDFMLRQLEFYELMNSPHPVYILDSSNPENAEKLKNGVEKYKNLNVVYKWFPPGNDYEYQLLPLVKEKYCIQIGDDDLIFPSTISECADFLESYPDYATCAGKQVNVRFRKHDRIKPYGIIEHQTRPLGRSIEDENMLVRAKNFWLDQTFLGLSVRRIETERAIRNITKNFFMMGDMTEFLIMSVLITSGKSKSLDKLGQVMQLSDLRSFDHGLVEDFLLYSHIVEEWKICLDGFSEILTEKGLSKKESQDAIKGIFIVFLYQQYTTERFWLAIGNKKSSFAWPDQLKQDLSNTFSKQGTKGLFKKIRHRASHLPFLRSIYYKFNPPDYVDKPESKYFDDFKVVKDFLEGRANK
ncbi:MAG: hypothetical protein A3B86_02750 [Candidatus Yanofskybacteria bacterium RIFCSPHIGHO2_02_FULL_38_22b]|uniref:Glycosyltransferase 2-like domain-containing protein n=1 Tax=Candidatus Yanofskybacteria bacterium RIFCSPHIGHO2_02_FULL_38_22b TaxID=1802673 RepID=A0A1F8F3Q5_9BACT|nr:MAG: hypothetical protein A2816_03105 [Candidatus Yanofskybacteria bacterium RIFCSPHIGHO2_01_FULL_39_44]OGN07774.1 MAG: hypothetical protein A3B86_02750 [Candidatus Yanofskybacteria bacterium RIFCSPHIGHO2_02_FULL_38_22b]OGN20657.1 MAG: hypothetical protein A2910_02585 [Candidatus Yanofskybacteria bacterium RIFCSPLOWO2_01_FULL_39_28]